MKNEVCIVIPIHSPSPKPYELISFQQCFRILNSHPIKIVAPKGLSLAAYRKVIPQFETITIDPKWQADLFYYNKLKKSRFFYNLFREYNFLLTYELDAFVFSDELEYWCDRGYDYIGAPWFEGYNTAGPNASLMGVGNSGFSLRKIKPIQRILKSWFYKNPKDYDTNVMGLLKTYLKTPYQWLRNQMGENYTIQYNYEYHEDIFFCEAVPQKFKDFKIAPISEAIKFSFEVKPEYLFQLNNNQLPMGCHAWWRYNLDFWKPHIESFGYRL
jgi:hypothetical protein